MLVFKGRLGNEDNAVIGQSFKRGKLKFFEEWTDGLRTVEHNWFHTIQGSEQNFDNGETINTVNNGILEKDNIRYVNDRRAGSMNHLFILWICVRIRI